MKQVDCIQLDGSAKRVDTASLIFRPAAYAILLLDGKILLTQLKATGKYHLPGGGIEPGERIEETLHREVLEETGIQIEVNRMVEFEELFFYYNPSGKAYHGLHFYFLCTPMTNTLLTETDLLDGSAENPCWLAVETLNADDFQHGGEKVLAICRDAAMKNIFDK